MHEYTYIYMYICIYREHSISRYKRYINIHVSKRCEYDTYLKYIQIHLYLRLYLYQDPYLYLYL